MYPLKIKYKPYKNEFFNEKEIKGLFQILIFYELPLYDELSVVEISKAFEGYVRSYKFQIIQPKYHLVQLKASKSSIEGLFKDL